MYDGFDLVIDIIAAVAEGVFASDEKPEEDRPPEKIVQSASQTPPDLPAPRRDQGIAPS